jgi:ribosomal protein S12 methylthiotransferase accessory factor
MSVRSRDAGETDRLLRELGPELGITRVADVTQLDTLGIPCYTAVRPGLGTSVYSGKALNPIDARVGAQMEAIETAVAFAQPPVVCYGPFEIAARFGPALDPSCLAIGSTAAIDPRAYPDDWVEGHALPSGARLLVPAAAVYLGHRSTPPWYASSNGLASGNNITEAIAHGLAEVIERDALCLHDLAIAPDAMRAFLRVLATPPSSPCLPRLPGVRTVLDFANVDLESLPPTLLAACRGAVAGGARVYLRAITSDIGVPVFACLIHQQHGDGALQHIGSGCHPDAAVAARRAITEAAQCRATYIQGAREDLPEPALTQANEIEAHWLIGPLQDFAGLPSHSFADVRDDIAFMLDRLSDAGLHQVIAVDLGDPAWPIAIGRVIVCGAEPPLEMDGVSGPWMGWRARSALGLAGIRLPAT